MTNPTTDAQRYHTLRALACSGQDEDAIMSLALTEVFGETDLPGAPTEAQFDAVIDAATRLLAARG